MRRVALATCGELLDWNYRYAQFVPGAGFAALEDLPSEYIKRQVYATIETDPGTLASILWHGRKLAEARRAGEVAIEGDRGAVTRFLGLFPLPAA